MKECAVKTENETLFAKITCEIDHHTAKSIRESIDGKLSEKGVKVVILDFSAVSFMDSSGIGLIIGRAAKAAEIGAAVEVRGLSRSLRRLVCMSGMERISNIEIK